MSSEATCPITLTVAGDPRLARLVRMTAANVGALCSMSVDRIEDARRDVRVQHKRHIHRCVKRANALHFVAMLP